MISVKSTLSLKKVLEKVIKHILQLICVVLNKIYIISVSKNPSTAAMVEERHGIPMQIDNTKEAAEEDTKDAEEESKEAAEEETNDATEEDTKDLAEDDDDKGYSKKISKRKKMLLLKKEQRGKYREAAKAWASGRYCTLGSCAKAFGVELKHLNKGITLTGGIFPGSGNFSKIIMQEEGQKMADHVHYVGSIGYGVSYYLLRQQTQRE